MAFDGITVAAVVQELEHTLVADVSPRSPSQKMTNCF